MIIRFRIESKDQAIGKRQGINLFIREGHENAA